MYVTAKPVEYVTRLHRRVQPGLPKPPRPENHQTLRFGDGMYAFGIFMGIIGGGFLSSTLIGSLLLLSGETKYRSTKNAFQNFSRDLTIGKISFSAPPETLSNERRQEMRWTFTLNDMDYTLFRIEAHKQSNAFYPTGENQDKHMIHYKLVPGKTGYFTYELTSLVKNDSGITEQIQLDALLDEQLHFQLKGKKVPPEVITFFEQLDKAAQHALKQQGKGIVPYSVSLQLNPSNANPPETKSAFELEDAVESVSQRKDSRAEQMEVMKRTARQGGR